MVAQFKFDLISNLFMLHRMLNITFLNKGGCSICRNAFAGMTIGFYSEGKRNAIEQSYNAASIHYGLATDMLYTKLSDIDKEFGKRFYIAPDQNKLQ